MKLASFGFATVFMISLYAAPSHAGPLVSSGSALRSLAHCSSTTLVVSLIESNQTIMATVEQINPSLSKPLASEVVTRLAKSPDARVAQEFVGEHGSKFRFVIYRHSASETPRATLIFAAVPILPNHGPLQNEPLECAYDGTQQPPNLWSTKP